MSEAVRAFIATTTTSTEDEETKPTLASLLLSLDSCNRHDLELVPNTISELVDLARGQGEDVTAAVKDALLVAFKRRNHDKSLAEGEGAGEKSFFLEVLLAVLALKDYDELVVNVLPLLPLYGCWRDVRVLGEEIILRGLVSLQGEKGPDHPVYRAVCNLYAEQLLADAADEGTPSNACKHAPHEHRYGRAEKPQAREDDETKDATPMDVAAHSEDETPHTVRHGRTKRKGRAKYVAASTSMVAKYTRAQRHGAAARLAKDVARISCPEECARHCIAAAYRKLRARLNKSLADKGHLVEPLICSKDFSKIDFEKASKGALVKYKASITKHGQMPRWQEAMRRNIKAVPDLDSLSDAIRDFRQESQSMNAENSFFHRRVEKARLSMQNAKQKLLTKATSLLRAANSARGTKIVKVPLLVAVDTAETTEGARSALVLSAYLVASAQGAEFLAIDGVVVALSSFDDSTWNGIADVHVPAASALQRFRDGVQGLLRRAAEQNAAAEREGEATTSADVLFLCESFSAYEQDKESVLSAIDQAKADTLQLGVSLRSLRVHRLRVGDGDDDDDGFTPVPYIPRPELRNLPADPAEVTVDLVFLVDFTGSMGSYMDAVKRELVGVISTIRDSVRLKKVRVALVGYRDYNDTGRVVSVDFHDAAQLDVLLRQIESEDASGGGDTPEDLLSGLVAAAKLSWQSHIRVQVIITDANAHGFQKGGGDDHPTGRCPDQRGSDYPSLQEITRQLADVFLVDTFFCQLDRSTLPTQEALQEAHLDGRGFGTIAMGRRGAANFRHKVIASISKAVLSTFVKEDVQGLQTFDGITVSSLTASLNSSLRETLQAMGISSTDPAEEKKVAPTDWQRLERELQVNALNPVRLALGLQVFSASKLSHAAHFALFRAGITAQELLDKGYPDSIVSPFQSFLLQLLSKA